MCGVSTQTVSRVINKRPDVSPRTRQAVEAAIAAVGFQPSEVARSLVQRRSQMLGIVAAGLRYFGVAQTLNGITEESDASGYVLLLKEISTSDAAEMLSVIEFLIAHRVEGIIFAAPDVGANIPKVREHLPVGSPRIIFLKAEPSPDFSTIAIDNYAGSREATEHLISLGRRRIVHVGGPAGWHEAKDRHDGWRDALHDAGLEPGAVRFGNWSSASGAAAFEELLAVDPDLDGVVAANDQMALGVLHIANGRGIAVPGDVAVVGFDGLDEAEQFTPSLTTVRQPLQELGKLAVRELLVAIDEPDRTPVRALTLTPELIVRDSAPVPGQAAAARPAVRPTAAGARAAGRG